MLKLLKYEMILINVIIFNHFRNIFDLCVWITLLLPGRVLAVIMSLLTDFAMLGISIAVLVIVDMCLLIVQRMR